MPRSSPRLIVRDLHEEDLRHNLGSDALVEILARSAGTFPHPRPWDGWGPDDTTSTDAQTAARRAVREDAAYVRHLIAHCLVVEIGGLVVGVARTHIAISDGDWETLWSGDVDYADVDRAVTAWAGLTASVSR